MTKPHPFRVGIVGLSPQGRDLLECLSLQPHCEFVLHQTSATETLKPIPLAGVSRIADWHRFLFESELKAVLFLDGLALDPSQLQAVLEAKFPVGVLPPLTGDPSLWQPFTSTGSEQLRILGPQFENSDFRAALAGIQSGETGPVTAIKRVSWVPDLIEPNPPKTSPDGWFSQWLWDDVAQLLCLTRALPESVFAAEFSEKDQRYFL
ncbi:MAG: hypothetical protein KDA84_25825, partial [Planctomycetaceae bacterium]|nr:hypothetical protein [Planctomycetaceae bacterium]